MIDAQSSDGATLSLYTLRQPPNKNVNKSSVSTIYTQKAVTSQTLLANICSSKHSSFLNFDEGMLCVSLLYDVWLWNAIYAA